MTCACTPDARAPAFSIKSIEDLANWKFFHMARAIATLAAVEESGARSTECVMNIDEAVDKAFEKKPFKELLDAPPSALQGLAPW